jgi:hypothetical protein
VDRGSAGLCQPDSLNSRRLRSLYGPASTGTFRPSGPARTLRAMDVPGEILRPGVRFGLRREVGQPNLSSRESRTQSHSSWLTTIVPTRARWFWTAGLILYPRLSEGNHHLPTPNLSVGLRSRTG